MLIYQLMRGYSAMNWRNGANKDSTTSGRHGGMLRFFENRDGEDRYRWSPVSRGWLDCSIARIFALVTAGFRCGE